MDTPPNHRAMWRGLARPKPKRVISNRYSSRSHTDKTAASSIFFTSSHRIHPLSTNSELAKVSRLAQPEVC